MRRLRILTWHVHGNYLWYLSQLPHEFHLVTDTLRSSGHAGRSGTLPWGDNVHEVMAHAVREHEFDLVLFQSRAAWDDEQHRILSPAQRRLPRIYLEHDPPQQHPTDTRHAVDDPEVLLVHCTHFNALMWDSGRTPVRVIEHGVKLLDPKARWHGTRDAGLVVVNNLDRRGRRLGHDVYLEVAARVPLALVGMGSQRCGGEGEVGHAALPARMAEHRFFFHPIRWTSLGLALIEAMLVGAPVVGLATTELAAVIRDGQTGFIDTRTDRLVEAMQALRADRGLAQRIGEAGRAMARERFGIERFVADWQATLVQVAG
jgi:glycosyltransferase involved in cell wall biosynthesis